jgi:hypothetical protein
MKHKEIRFPETSLTEETCESQGWKKHYLDEDDGFFDTNNPLDDKDEMEDDENRHYYFTLPLPKDQRDKYRPYLVSNATNETRAIKDIGLLPGSFFIEMMGTEGLGFCTTEEELEVLYYALVGESIEEKFGK